MFCEKVQASMIPNILLLIPYCIIDTLYIAYSYFYYVFNIFVLLCMCNLAAPLSPKQPEAPMEQLNIMNRGESTSILKFKCTSNLTEPEMLDLIRKVIPNIRTEWEDVAYALHYEISIVHAIKEKHVGDSKRCCRELLEDWLSTDHGARPKTWATLLKAIGHIEELTRAREDILQDLQLESGSLTLI